jgi:phospholipid/cholesterol/gamma-HCH transport system substrate-binding protein
MSRSMVGRLLALGVVTLVGFYYILFDAVGFKVVDRPFTVHVVMPVAGGIYPEGYVTYRGVEVGRVAALHLQQDRVIADLSINRGTRIPADVNAQVKGLTAAGEQYMDLVPLGRTGPYLRSGSVIPEDHTTVPVSIGTLLDTLNTLVQSLHASDLNTLSRAMATGLGNAGPELRAIIVDGNTLVTALQSAIPGTQQLINSGNTVLSTFQSTSGEFAQFSANLNVLSRQVAQSNSDLIALLQNGSTASTSLSQFLAQNGQPGVSLIDGLASTTSVAYDREPAFQALFQILPLFANDVAMVTSGGQIRFELTFNTADPVCPYTTTMAEPTALVAAADLNRNCTTDAPNLLQRGADKAPPPLRGP